MKAIHCPNCDGYIDVDWIRECPKCNTDLSQQKPVEITEELFNEKGMQFDIPGET